MNMYRYQLLLYGLLGIGLLLLLAACGSTAGANPVSAPTSTTHPGPTATSLVTAIPVPMQALRLTVAFGCKTGVKEGFFADRSHAFACARTFPGATLTISVSYCNGNSDQRSSLQGTFTADSTGYYEWDWKPQAPCQNGPAYWSGKARLNGQTASGESVFQAD